MSKKNFLILVLFITLFIGLFLTLETFRNNPDGINITLEDRTRTTILIDINPSIKIELNRDNDIIKTNTIKGDNYINKDYKNKSLEEFINDYIIILKEKNIVNNTVDLLLNVDGLLTKEEVDKVISKVSEKNKISINVIYIDNTYQEENKYDISNLKLAYINSIIGELDYYKIEDLKDKTINELLTIKTSDYYCSKDYILDGSMCLKQIGKEQSEIGKVCPEGYAKKNKKCYKVEYPYEELGCSGGQSLEEGVCTGTKKIDAKIKCKNGEYD